MKRVLLITTCIFVFISSVLLAQKEHNIWYFGFNAGLDFNSGVPVALTDGVINQIEGCATTSDVNGNLLFYTDGLFVWDSSHTQMPNGYSLGGGWSSTQSALIVPFPNNNSLYYIFTVPTGGTYNFTYSIVDMSLNNGKGDITIKNNYLYNPVGEKLTAVKHSNGTDVWVMVHESGSSNFIAFLVSSTGISLPIISTVGLIPSGMGYMRFSPDGSKIAFAGSHVSGNIEVFDFNSSTGAVANPKAIAAMPLNPQSGSYGLEFSPSGKYLYCLVHNAVPYHTIYQWDVSSNNDSIINASEELIFTDPTATIYALQLGPDGKIYTGEYADSISVINNPELPGTSCNFVNRSVSLDGKQCGSGLPNFITSYFLPTGVKENDQNQNQLSVFPNPASTLLTIQSNTKTDNTTVILYNTLGEQLLTKQFKEKTTIDISRLPQGIYFVTLSNDDYRVTRKVVKE